VRVRGGDVRVQKIVAHSEFIAPNILSSSAPSHRDYKVPMQHVGSFLLKGCDTKYIQLRQWVVSIESFWWRLGFVHADNGVSQCRIYHCFPQLPQRGHNSQLNVVL
jgi:hypothetical protein